VRGHRHSYTIQLHTKTPVSLVLPNSWSLRDPIKMHSLSCLFSSQIQGSRKYHHIDLSMSTQARNPAAVHGLLGVSHRPSTPVPGGLAGEGVLEGVLADYEVKDGIFGTDTKFNRVRTRLGSSLPSALRQDSSLAVVACAQFKGEQGLYSAERCAKLLTSSKELADLPMRGSFDGL
jgi:hypothetical protein